LLLSTTNISKVPDNIDCFCPFVCISSCDSSEVIVEKLVRLPFSKMVAWSQPGFMGKFAI